MLRKLPPSCHIYFRYNDYLIALMKEKAQWLVLTWKGVLQILGEREEKACTPQRALWLISVDNQIIKLVFE